jgi:Helix-turn-helix.
MPRDYLKELREGRNMSMQSVADRIGISRQYYQLIEAGERQKKMDITLVIALSNLFDVAPEQIINQEQKNIETEDT